MLRPLSPSIAVVTVTAGVIIPSERKVAPPIIAGIKSHLAFFLTNVYSAKMPPSPLLSARSAIRTYLVVVIIVKVQKIKEILPRIKSVEIFCKPPLPATKDDIVYMGEVPISP